MNSIFTNDLNLFFDTNGFAEDMSYTQNAVTANVQGIINEVFLDNAVDGFVEKQANIIVRKQQLIDAGIAEPKAHDTINGIWEVVERIENMGIYKLGCVAVLRPKP